MTEATKHQNPIAVIGMHGRFPAAYDVAEFWSNLMNGYDAFRQIPDDRWQWQDYFGSAQEDGMHTTVNCAAFMPDIDKFDHRYFGIMPREAESMDPQQRLFLQTAYLALEDAGIRPSKLAGGQTGVFVGIGNAEYHTMMVRDNARFDLFRGTGLALTSIANRVSFHLDIHGPSETLDTACSGSLVAIHRAIQSMRAGECEEAIVGGVNLLIGPDLFVAFDKAGMLSPDARSKTFDSGANGYARGEGVAALILRPLEEAQKKGDHIYAVIHGSAENHGGRAHSFTAPNAKSQAAVVKKAWENSNKNFLDAVSIETHGTGTPLGDPIEVNGLKTVAEYFNEVSDKPIKQSIALGALKSHVGHMEAAAGVGGVIKTILSLTHHCLPANLHFKELNPHIDLTETPFTTPTAHQNLQTGEEHLAGVSSFGFGGVNAHVVIGTYQEDSNNQNDVENRPYLILLSARDEEALTVRVEQLRSYLPESKKDIHEEVISCLGNVDQKNAVTIETPLYKLLNSSFKRYCFIRDLENSLSIKIDLGVLVGCYSVKDLIGHIYHSYEQSQRLSKDYPDYIQAKVCLPNEQLQNISLAQIALSLQEGRDHYKRRFACVARSKAELKQKLEKYLNEPNKPESSFWTGQASTDSSEIEKPEVTEKRATGEQLNNWANWWLNNKSADLVWADLYANESRPIRAPLPAYPFRRNRIWYTANKEVNLQDKSTVAKALEKNNVESIPVSNSHNKEKVILSEDIFDAWKEFQKDAKGTLSSSILTTGLLIDYAAHRSVKETYTLRDIVFSKPEDINSYDIRFSELASHSTRTDETEIFCLSVDKPHRIFVRGRLSKSEYKKTNHDSNFKVQQKISKLKYIQELDRQSLLTGSLQDWLSNIESTERGLICNITIGQWTARSSQFWVPLLHCVHASLAYLSLSQGGHRSAISMIEKCLVQKTDMAEVKSFHVSYESSKQSFLIDFISADKQILMSWSGVKLRRFVPSELHSNPNSVVGIGSVAS